MLSLIDDRKRHSELLNRLNIMRKSNAFCDVTINVENNEFSGHKVILASSSDYFLSKFTEDNSNCFSLNLKKDIFSLLLEYFYTSNLLVSKETIPQIYSAAKFLKVKRVVKVCEQYLLKHLTIDNVLEIRESISIVESEELCIQADKFVNDNFDSIIINQAYSTITMDILVDAYPTKETSSNLAEVALDWLEYALTENNVKIIDLIEENIRLYLNSSKTLVPLSEFHANRKSSSYVRDYIQGYSNNQKQTISKHVKSRPRSKERIPRGQTNMISNNSMINQITSSSKNSSTIQKLTDNEEVLLVSTEDNEGNNSQESENITRIPSSEDSSPNQDNTNSINVNKRSIILRKGMSVELDGNAVDRFIVDDCTPPTSGQLNHLTNASSSMSSSGYYSRATTTMHGISSRNEIIASVGSSSVYDENEDNDSGDFNSVSSTKSTYNRSSHTETALIAIKCNEATDDFGNSLGIHNKIEFVVKLCGKTLFVSLHIKTTDDFLEGNENNDQIENYIYEVNKATSTTSTSSNRNCDVFPELYSGLSLQSPFSSSSVSAASSQLHISTENDEKHQKSMNFEYIAKMSTPRCAAGVVNVGEKIMVIGGFNRGECLNTVEFYDPYRNSWTDGCGMKSPRGRLVALNLNSNNESLESSMICAIAGSDGSRELNTVERYMEDDWYRLGCLRQARSHHSGCVVLSSGGTRTMVVIGGIIGSNILKCCEYYDAEKNVWLNLAPLKTARSHAAVTAIDHQIFVVGGAADSWHCLSSGEVLDMREGKWRPLPELNHPRRGAALVPYNGNLFLFGGSDGTSSLRSMEVLDLYCSQSNTDSDQYGWQQAHQQLKQARVNVSGTLLLNQNLLAIGGYTGKHFLDTMEWAELNINGSSSSCNGNGSAVDMIGEWSVTVPSCGNWSDNHSFQECCCQDKHIGNKYKNKSVSISSSTDDLIENEDQHQITLTPFDVNSHQLRQFITNNSKLISDDTLN